MPANRKVTVRFTDEEFARVEKGAAPDAPSDWIRTMTLRACEPLPEQVEEVRAAGGDVLLASRDLLTEMVDKLLDKAPEAAREKLRPLQEAMRGIVNGALAMNESLQEEVKVLRAANLFLSRK